MIYKRALLTGLTLAALQACVAQQSTDARDIRGNKMIEINHSGQCVTLFVGFGARAADFGMNPASGDLTLSKITLILSPTCQGGRKYPVGSIWPDFAKHLRFAFFADNGPATAEDPNQRLDAKAIEEDRTVWGETGAVRTLVFEMKAFPSSASALLVEAELEGEQIAKVRVALPLPPKRKSGAK
jgi:hypothetical protein